MAIMAGQGLIGLWLFQQSASITWISFFVALGCAILVSILLIRMIVRPLEHLQGVARAVMEGDQDRRVSPSGTVEFDEAADALNRMLDAVQATSRNVTDLKKAEEALALDLTLRRQNEEAVRELNINLEQRIAERTMALRESEEQFRSAMEYSAIGMAVVALEGKWLKVNEALCRLLGYTREEFIALDFQTITHPDDLEMDLEQVRRLLNGEIETYQMEKRYFRKDRTLVWAILSVSLVRDSLQQPKYFISQIQDITKRKHNEEVMRRALEHEKELVREAQVGERAKSEFLAVMSHEIRTPMNGILGFAEMLTKMPALPAEGQDYAETIVKSGEILLRILDDILDFSRLEAKGLRIDKEEIFPTTLVEGISVLLAPSARDKGLKLKFEIDPTLAANCFIGDAARIRQILLNLGANAIKFTEKGMVTFGVQSRSSDLSEIDPGLEFVVRDTGPGIPADRIEKIFEAFVQADSSTSRRYGGTGLGLTICRRLSELMGGQLIAHSKVGEGSEFVVRLPLKRVVESKSGVESPQENEPQDETFAAKHPLRILIAEDDRINSKLIVTMFRKLGYEPLAARNGFEAVSIFHAEWPDCILLDLQMPEMDGIEAARQMREIEKTTGKIPAFISALTANTVPEDQRRCFEAGMNDYLNKPVKRAQLIQMLAKANAHASRQGE